MSRKTLTKKEVRQIAREEAIKAVNQSWRVFNREWKKR